MAIECPHLTVHRKAQTKRLVLEMADSRAASMVSGNFRPVLSAVADLISVGNCMSVILKRSN